MSRHWREKLNPKKHRDYMISVGDGGHYIEPPRDNLIIQYVYFVEVVGFTFQFSSIAQIYQALEYCKQKTHPSTLKSGIFLEHYWQKWYERLPKGLLKGTKRDKVVKALEKAVLEFKNS